MKVPAYNKENRKNSNGNFEQLPKGNYVCKICEVKEHTSKAGKPMLKIAFDIAEGEYKDFYKKRFDEDDREEKKWPADAVYYMTIPEDGCAAFISDQWDTFWANVEDSNNGYVFTGDEKTVKGKTFGGIFRIEQSQAESGQIYNHTRLFRTRIAQDIRDGKVTWSPKDKIIEQDTSGELPDFLKVPEGAPSDLPF